MLVCADSVAEHTNPPDAGGLDQKSPALGSGSGQKPGSMTGYMIQQGLASAAQNRSGVLMVWLS